MKLNDDAPNSTSRDWLKPAYYHMHLYVIIIWFNTLILMELSDSDEALIHRTWVSREWNTGTYMYLFQKNNVENKNKILYLDDDDLCIDF